MYHLTPRMTQRLWRYLDDYHKLFDGGRCSGWELEELIVKAIKDDTTAQHQVFWKEAGHDDKADIEVINDKKYLIQVKSGQFDKVGLMLSGYRLTRFASDFDKITDYLNNTPADCLAVPYKQTNGPKGRQHAYELHYIEKDLLQGVEADKWEEKGKQFVQTNASGVVFSLRPAMSWQIWWQIPKELLQENEGYIVS